MHKTFRYPKLLETPKGSFTNFVGIVRQQISDGNSWYSTLPPFAPPPPPSHKPSGYPKVSGTQKKPPTKIFSPVRQQILHRKSLYSSLFPPSTLVFINFWDRKISQQHRRNPSRCFSVLWDTPFPTENHDIPSFISNPSWYPETSGTQKKSRKNFFWSCKTKKVDGKSWNMSLIFNISRHQNFTEKQKDSTTKFFDTLSQKHLTEKGDKPGFCIKFFLTGNFLKQRRIPLRFFTVMWDNKFPTATRDTPSFPLRPSPLPPPPLFP